MHRNKGATTPWLVAIRGKFGGCDVQSAPVVVPCEVPHGLLGCAGAGRPPLEWWPTLLTYIGCYNGGVHVS